MGRKTLGVVVAITGLAIVVAIGFLIWNHLNEGVQAYEQGVVRAIRDECSTLLQEIGDDEIPAGRTQGEVAFCVREGNFSIDDLNRAGEGELASRLLEWASSRADGRQPSRLSPVTSGMPERPQRCGHPGEPCWSRLKADFVAILVRLERGDLERREQLRQ